MTLYSFVAKDKDNSLALRQAVRPAHLKHLANLGATLVLAGPFQTEDGTSTGSLVVVEAESLDAAKAIFARDPYVVAGLFGSQEVSRWALNINQSEGR